MSKQSVQPFDRITRRVYAFEVDGTIVYVGSSSCSLSTLDFNHRNALTKYPKEADKQTTFRKTLAVDRKLQQGEFKTMLEIEGITQPEIEDLEGQLIRFFNPKFNKDKDPVRTSRTWGKRY